LRSHRRSTHPFAAEAEAVAVVEAEEAMVVEAMVRAEAAVAAKGTA
jgi:hypothetical protein